MKKLYLKTLIIVSIALMCITMIGCDKKEENKYETLLKIGNIELTKNQYVKSKNLYIGSNKIDTLTGAKLREFNQSVIDDCFLAADAFSNGYQKNDSILEAVNAIADFMLTKYDGYLWKHTRAKEAKVTEKEIEDIYNQPHVIYFLDAITFKKRLISDTTNDVIIKKIKNKEDFDYYLSVSDTVKNISNSKLMSSWPVYEMGQGNDYLKDAKIGDIIGPVRTTQGVIIAKLTKTDIVKKHPYKDESQRLEMILDMLKTDQISINEQKRCENLCKPKYNDKNVERFLSEANDKDFQNDVLVEYNISGKLKKLAVSEFKNFLKYYVYQTRMNSPIDVKVNIREKIGMDYLMVEVDSLKLREDPLFIDEYNGYLRKLIVNHYLSKELKPDLSDLNNEVKIYYKENPDLYREPEYLMVSCFEFDNMAHLLEAQPIINKAFIIGNESMLNDTSLINGMKNYLPDLIMKRDSTFLSNQNYDYLIMLPLHTLSNEFRENGKYYLFYKKQKSGEIIKPFDLVKEEIKYKLTNEKTETEKQKLLVQLKNKYIIEIDKLETIKD